MTEELRDRVLVGTEGDVADKQGVALRAGLVTEVPSAGLGAVLVVVVVGWAASSVVEVDLATINLGVLLGVVSLGSVGRVDVLDITETAGATRVAVGDNANTRKLTEALELLAEPLLVDVPGQVTNEEVRRSARSLLISLLRLLGGGSGLLLSLALLGGLLRLGLGRVRIRAFGVVRFIRILGFLGRFLIRSEKEI